jgi:hypothetical protein
MVYSINSANDVSYDFSTDFRNEIKSSDKCSTIPHDMQEIVLVAAWQMVVPKCFPREFFHLTVVRRLLQSYVCSHIADKQIVVFIAFCIFIKAVLRNHENGFIAAISGHNKTARR